MSGRSREVELPIHCGGRPHQQYVDDGSISRQAVVWRRRIEQSHLSSRRTGRRERARQRSVVFASRHPVQLHQELKVKETRRQGHRSRQADGPVRFPSGVTANYFRRMLKGDRRRPEARVGQKARI